MCLTPRCDAAASNFDNVVAHLNKINNIVEQTPETRDEGWTLYEHFMDTNWWEDVKWSADCDFQLNGGLC